MSTRQESELITVSLLVVLPERLTTVLLRVFTVQDTLLIVALVSLSPPESELILFVLVATCHESELTVPESEVRVDSVFEILPERVRISPVAVAR